ncbi:alkaline shock response membrane anchor protein AmaP [Streptomyces caniscabiei]|uniref:alkaline shock response membrane anchor protein AmaP n=1 Tax=Streptomyces caniscabiei TaxID=2746961 RepID=UPI001CE0BC2C|nr:alkaline shock response membrane anchor protein AmaP [Streptomyces caniscabiei]MDX3515374.1 alkaline shock response membrane anchor protein AmaP [Streptomyces caniscabiei]MDX3724275.1 alkaline shock response membrane anchor protein AmaP [Streptomyces caniscabiei]MDX3732736.1 alkaline shock response membrane anchor protein AmaP [Streptomyces caniscabiei]WEO27951.1 alkaline shock response membrane anchor protein AmaP [Streptomyces caniscabiei]
MNPADSGRPPHTQETQETQETRAARHTQSAEAVAPGGRGATRIADRVVAKIAAQAAREALVAPAPASAPPNATVVVVHETARVRVTLGLLYPSDIGGQCAAVRRHVTERVGTLAGMRVTEVAVQVERLHLAHAHDVAQGRTR